MNVKEYIESGALELYVLGAASDDEAKELLHLKKQHPEIEQALIELETDLERLAQYSAIAPPPTLFKKIEDDIKDLIKTDNRPHLTVYKGQNGHDNDQKSRFIEVEAETNQMRIHKAWRWVFAAVFLLSKIFLIASIYYYLENRQAQEQIQQLKTELKQYNPHKY
jgi:hypothetical protein